MIRSHGRTYNPPARMTKLYYHRYYLKTPHWAAVKGHLLKLHPACQLCGHRPPRLSMLNPHHITYARLWHERDSDIIILCEHCHIERVHKAGEFTKDDLFAITGGAEGQLPAVVEAFPTEGVIYRRE